ncbi:MAG: TraR/DksA family transcriptional regulator [Verrucomicrobia bacterium]|nr:TraR/DksA family transcriptional regulator [Verrucomicrobiota bacterium]
MHSTVSPVDHLAELRATVPAKWLWHLETLLRLRERLDGQAHGHLADAGDTRKTDHDFADRASDESEFEALISAVRSEEGVLTEIDAALDRLQRGTYGICEVSLLPIPYARLRALPWTRHRREVAAQLEADRLP